MKIKHLVSVLIAWILLSFYYSCSKSDNTPGDNGTGGNASAITISGMAFPASTTVKKGATVTWTNKDTDAHTVTSDDNTTFSSGNMAAGATFSYVAKTVGSFLITVNIIQVCVVLWWLHPKGIWSCINLIPGRLLSGSVCILFRSTGPIKKIFLIKPQLSFSTLPVKIE